MHMPVTIKTKPSEALYCKQDFRQCPPPRWKKTRRAKKREQRRESKQEKTKKRKEIKHPPSPSSSSEEASRRVHDARDKCRDQTHTPLLLPPHPISHSCLLHVVLTVSSSVFASLRSLVPSPATSESSRQLHVISQGVPSPRSPLPTSRHHYHHHHHHHHRVSAALFCFVALPGGMPGQVQCRLVLSSFLNVDVFFCKKKSVEAAAGSRAYSKKKGGRRSEYWNCMRKKKKKKKKSTVPLVCSL